MKLRIYLDTSVISAYFDDRAPDRMVETKAFWLKLSEFEVSISSLVRTAGLYGGERWKGRSERSTGALGCLIIVPMIAYVLYLDSHNDVLQHVHLLVIQIS